MHQKIVKTFEIILFFAFKGEDDTQLKIVFTQTPLYGSKVDVWFRKYCNLQYKINFIPKAKPSHTAIM